MAVSSAAFTGLRTYSTTLSLMASLAYSNSSKPEKTMSFRLGLRRESSAPSSSPSMKGILMSVRTTSSSRASAFSRASRPFSASATISKPTAFQSIFLAMAWRTSASSSTIMIL